MMPRVPRAKRHLPVMSNLRGAPAVIVVLVFCAWMALGALGLLRVPLHANEAKAALQAVKAALEAGDAEQAADEVEAARRHVDDAQDSAQGLSAHVWSRLPLVGGPVRDVRHLSDALDALTAVAEVGVETWPAVSGDSSTLFDEGDIDITTLTRLIGAVESAIDRLDEARSDLEAVADERLLGGTRLAEARDTALADLARVQEASDRLEPLLPVLPRMLGAEGPRRYLVAILNPSELLYSGGTALTFAPISFDEGRIRVGRTVDTAHTGEAFVPRYWRKVPGNPFHRGRLRIATGAKAPSWPVAGEEVLNAWRSIRGVQGAGLIAIDVPALARLAQITGPMEVEGYGTVSAENLVQVLIGNYDNIPDPYIRHRINVTLVPLFRERLFSGGDFLEKAEALHEMAQGRHFAVFFRDDEIQAAFDGLGMTGDLSDTDHDYLGVFTQSAVPAKTDYYQSRALRSRVELAEDGSARVELEVRIHNDTPPYAFDGEDPREGYFTRWLHASVGTFLPKGAEVRRASVDGVPFDFHVGDYFGRPFVRRTVVLRPQQRRTVRLVYDVPSAAVVEKDGTLAYRLDVDPQGTVRPQAIAVTVRFPEGHAATGLPAGWAAKNPRTVVWGGPALVTSPRFELRAEPSP